MSDKVKIKVIKREDIVPQKGRKRRKSTPRNTAREMVTTVGQWVNDLKDRKSEETKAAVDLLLGRSANPNES